MRAAGASLAPRAAAACRTERAAPPTDRLAEIWEAVRSDRAPTAPDLRQPAANRWEREIPTADVPLLTDGYAPTDALLLG